MKYWITLSLVAALCSTATVAQENFRQKNRWLALMDYANVSAASLQSAAPHFPKTVVTDEKTLKEFEVKAEQWKKRHAKEAEALLALPEVKKLNPSRVHLGLQQAVDVRKFENSYWQWITAANLSAETIKETAPHIPLPDLKNPDIAFAERNFEFAFNDWMLLFAKEAEALFNLPAMKAHAVQKEAVEITSPTNDEAYLYVKVSEVKPEKSFFNSGNKALDAIRYETYLKAWYHRYNEEDFYRIYNPEQLAEWKKNRDASKPTPQH